jgi:hypothetical protein
MIRRIACFYDELSSSKCSEQEPISRHLSSWNNVQHSFVQNARRSYIGMAILLSFLLALSPIFSIIGYVFVVLYFHSKRKLTLSKKRVLYISDAFSGSFLIQLCYLFAPPASSESKYIKQIA